MKAVEDDFPRQDEMTCLLTQKEALDTCKKLMNCSGIDLWKLCDRLLSTSFAIQVVSLLKHGLVSNCCAWLFCLHCLDGLRILLAHKNELEIEHENQQPNIDEVVDVHLAIACRIQGRYIFSLEHGGHDSPSSQRFIGLYEGTLERLNAFCEHFPSTVAAIMNSGYFLQILATEEDELSLIAVRFLQKCLFLNNEETVQKLTSRQLTILLDEIIYILSKDSEQTLSTQCIRLLSQLSSALLNVRELLRTRYRGFYIFILNRLPDANLELGAYKTRHKKIDVADPEIMLAIQNLLRYCMHIDPQTIRQDDFCSNIKPAELSVTGPAITSRKRHEAAVVRIQAAWRGYKTRKRLRKAVTTLSMFQTQFRNKLQKRRCEEDAIRLEAELRYQLAASRRRLQRERDELELQLLQCLSTPLLQRHVMEKQCEAATKIQSFFRGWKERNRLAGRRDAARRFRAVILIQRWYRRKISIRHCPQTIQKKLADIANQFSMQDCSDYFTMQRLTDEQHQKYMQIHAEWCSRETIRPRTLEELELQHAQTQLLLERASRRRIDRQPLESVRQIKLAQTRSDAELLSEELAIGLRVSDGIPTSDGDLTTPLVRMAQASLAERKLFASWLHSSSRPLAQLATEQHTCAWRELGQPWWRRWHAAWRAGRLADPTSALPDLRPSALLLHSPGQMRSEDWLNLRDFSTIETPAQTYEAIFLND